MAGKAKFIDAVTVNGVVMVTVQFPKIVMVTQMFQVPAGTPNNKAAIVAAVLPLIQKEAAAEVDTRAPIAAVVSSPGVEVDI